MYTDTTRPNHLAQEAIDNAVDEAMAGFATTIHVTYEKDGAIAVCDNGRGMLTDIHPEHGISGIELIMTKLHQVPVSKKLPILRRATWSRDFCGQCTLDAFRSNGKTWR